MKSWECANLRCRLEPGTGSVWGLRSQAPNSCKRSRNKLNLPGSGQCSRWLARSSGAPQFGHSETSLSNHRTILTPVAQKVDVCLANHVLNMSGLPLRARSLASQST
eukprot:scaffold13589_cov49-Cyclotella_meneghiniana.AAC.5